MLLLYSYVSSTSLDNRSRTPSIVDSVHLTSVAPLSGRVSNKILYRNLINLSMDLEGQGGFHLNLSPVLSFISDMCYIYSDSFTGLEISETEHKVSSLYGRGQLFSMDVIFVDFGVMGYTDETYESVLLANEAETHREGIIGIPKFIREGGIITLIPEISSDIRFLVDAGTAEYTVGHGYLSDESLDEDNNCNGEDSGIFPLISRDVSSMSCETAGHIVLIQGTNEVKVSAIISWDTTLAQTEYSSGLLKHMKDFESLRVSDMSNHMLKELERRNLRMFQDSDIHLKIGVDVIRNMVIEFNFGDGYIHVCQAGFHSGFREGATSELHRIAASARLVQREENEATVKILIEYSTAVQVGIMRLNKYLNVVLDTGSEMTNIPESFKYPHEKGDSSFRCEYASGEICTGSKTLLSFTFPTRDKDELVPIKSAMIGGINTAGQTHTLDHGIIGLKYSDTMNSMPYIWNTEWMVFVPEVITQMKRHGDTFVFPDGYGTGRLEIRNDFNINELCQGKVVVSVPSDRTTWIVTGLTIGYIGKDGQEKIHTFDDILIDTGYTVSKMTDITVREEINQSKSIRLGSTRGISTLVLDKEPGEQFFADKKADRNVIGVKTGCRIQFESKS
jgi:hypothetical protein